MWTTLIHAYAAPAVRVTLLAAVGIPVIWFGSRALGQGLKTRLNEHISMLIEHLIFYGALTFLIISMLHELGFQLSALLGAAGIVGVAVGLAAQTSVSNIVCGIFLLLEQSFKVGDSITCDTMTGTVVSIDLLSVKIRTSDNRLIRIPNEFFIKKGVINSSYFPHRRLEFFIRVATVEEVQTVTHLVQHIVRQEHLFLKDPAPRTGLHDLIGGAYTVEAQVWVQPHDASEARRAFVKAMQHAAEEKEIEIEVGTVSALQGQCPHLSKKDEK